MGLNAKCSWERCRGRRAQKSVSATLCIFHVVCVKILPFLTFSQRLLFFSCAVTRVLMYLSFLEGRLEVAPAQNTRTGGCSMKKLSKWKNMNLLDRSSVLVFFAGAAFRWRSRKRKSISRREISQAAKKELVENNKRTMILTRQKTKSHKGFAHASCTRQDEESFFLSHVLLPV